MEAYFLASGVKHELDLFESIMQSQTFNLPLVDKEGKKFNQVIYGILSPIKLYKFVFPKEHIDEVVEMLGLYKSYKGGYKQFDKQAFALRKIMKAKKFLKPKKDTKKRLFPKLNLAIKGIGFKPDEYRFFESDGYFHEAI